MHIACCAVIITRSSSKYYSVRSMGSGSISFRFEYCCGAHAGSNAHGNHTEVLLTAVQLRQQCRHLSSTGAAERVPESDCATLWIHLLHVKAKFFYTVDSLAGKGFVKFKDINVVNGKLSSLKCFWDRNRWADSHYSRGDATYLEREKSSNNRTLKASSCRSVH